MDKVEKDHKFDSVYTTKVRAGKRRTYFFDVRQTKGEDYFVTITESTKKFDSNHFERHKIYLYKEDFNRFIEGLNDTVDHVKNNLLPDYDYEEFEKRQLEWEKSKALEEEQAKLSSTNTEGEGEGEGEASSTMSEESTDHSNNDSTSESSSEIEDDISW